MLPQESISYFPKGHCKQMKGSPALRYFKGVHSRLRIRCKEKSEKTKFIKITTLSSVKRVGMATVLPSFPQPGERTHTHSPQNTQHSAFQMVGGLGNTLDHTLQTA